MTFQRLRFTWSMILLLAIAFVPMGGVRAQAQDYAVLHYFTNGADGFDVGHVLSQDSKGNIYGTTNVGGVGGTCVVVGCGTIFKVDSSGNHTVLYNFKGGTDGSHPISGVIRDQHGNLYGTTQAGGALDVGTVFKLDSAGNHTVLYSFAGGADGSTPVGGLVRDSKGDLYGTTSAGGSGGGYGTIFQVSAGGTHTVLHNFSYSDGIGPAATLFRDSKRNLYGTTNSGGVGGYGTVFKLDSAGNYSVLHSFTGGAGGLEPYYAGVIGDPRGNLYGTTRAGGTFNFGTVFKLDADGNYTVLYSFTGGADGGYPMAGLVRDSKHNLYGTTEGGGTGGNCNIGCGIVFKLDSADTETVLHNFIGGSDGVFPMGELLRNSNGNLYGTTTTTVFRLKL
jgi:uncharacterized repeat protein (TIGR03803 family)